MSSPINDTIRKLLAGKFFAARKTKPIWTVRVADALAAGMIGSDLLVNTLEGPIKAAMSDALCKGVNGELWVQDFDQIQKKYLPTGATRRETGNNPTKPSIQWVEYAPKPDRTVQATAVEELESFQVQSKFGLLSGKRGDYVVYAQDDPDDMWIVAKNLFERTYTRA